MKKYLLEIERILKSNGLLIISTPNFHNPKNTLLKLFFQKPIMRWENNQIYLKKINIVDM